MRSCRSELGFKLMSCFLGVGFALRQLKLSVLNDVIESEDEIICFISFTKI